MYIKTEEITQAIEDTATKNTKAHKETQEAVSKVSTRLSKTSAAVSLLANDVIRELRSAIDDERRSRTETEEGIFRIPYSDHQAAMNQLRELKEEVHMLRTEFRQSLRYISKSVDNVSPEEDDKLRRRSALKGHLWAAKKLVLKSILVSVNASRHHTSYQQTTFANTKHSGTPPFRHD